MTSSFSAPARRRVRAQLLSVEPVVSDQIDVTPSHGKATAAEFDAFYRRELAGQVRRAALMLGSASAASDVVHDAFVAVYRRWSAIEEPGPYLNRCVLNGCRDIARRNKRTRSDERPAFVGDRSDDIATWDALSRLSYRQRAAVVMRHWQGLTEVEIAEAIGVRPGSVGPLLGTTIWLSSTSLLNTISPVAGSFV